MLSTGIIRQFDEFSLAGFPVALQSFLDIKDKDNLEIFVTNDSIVLKKPESKCMFYASEKDGLIEYRGRIISIAALKDIAEEAGFRMVPITD